MSTSSPAEPSGTPASSTNWRPEKRRFLEILTATVAANRWIPDSHQDITSKQAQFLAYEGMEALFGGAAGGGKSDALLAAALQYVDVPGYAALILMRSYSDLSLPKAAISRSKEWLSGTGAHWSGETKTWTFPSGATVTFGYLEHDDDRFRYRTAEFQAICFDELTAFSEIQYTFMFSRARRLMKETEVPIRVRSATNPGGPGHDWVKKRFIPDEFFRVGEHEQFSRVWVKNGRAFFPARLEDNPHLNTEEYERDALSQLDPVTRAQLRKGDWTAHAGGRFDRAWWRRYRRNVDLLVLDGGEYLPLQEVPRIVLVDPAGRKTKASKFTAIGTYGDFGRQRVGVLEMVRKQLRVEEIVPELERVCARWQPAWVGIEANGFQMFLVQAARGRPGIPTVMEMEPEGKSKLTRATPAIIRAEQGLFYLPDEADWLDEFETEHQMFTGDEKLDAYSDQVDVSAYAVLGMDKYGVGGMVPPLGVLSLR